MPNQNNQIYDNFFLSNEITDQLNSRLDLAQFCTVDRSLVGVPGMIRKINVYSATSGTEKLKKGEGNTKSITTELTEKEYEILLAQNNFVFYDEEHMADPVSVLTGIRHLGVDLYNFMQGDIYAEFAKATLSVNAATPNFDAFVDAQSLLGYENVEDVVFFGLVHPKDKAKVKKALKDDLKHVEAFVRTGYLGTVSGINLYTTKLATEGEITIATKEAVKLFVKKGVEVEQPPRASEDANKRKNTVFARSYYLPALYDATKAAKIILGSASNGGTDETNTGT